LKLQVVNKNNPCYHTLIFNTESDQRVE